MGHIVGIAQRSTAALIVVGTVVAGVALTSAPAQAASTKVVPLKVSTTTLTPAQVKKIIGEAQTRVAADRKSEKNAGTISVTYSEPAGNTALVSTWVIRGPKHGQLRKAVNQSVAGNQIVNKKYNAKTKSGIISYVVNVDATEFGATDTTETVQIAMTFRYTNKTAVGAAVATVTSTPSAKNASLTHKADQASKVLAKRFRITG